MFLLFFQKKKCAKTPIYHTTNIYSPVRYSYLSIFPDDNADIFAASLLKPYCSFSYLIINRHD